MNSGMNLSPTETARRFGVSIKALRLYERRSLLKPLRSKSGWRTYGPDQITRLHQILALKCLGLSLASIAQLLASADSLGTVRALQDQALVQESRRIARALALIRKARAAEVKALAIPLRPPRTIWGGAGWRTHRASLIRSFIH